MEPARHLRLLPTKDEFHPKIQRAVDNIIRCIIDIVVANKGKVSLKKIETITGLNKISNTLTADVIRYMIKQGVIELRRDVVFGDVSKLTQVIERRNLNQPKMHQRIWTESDYIHLCEMKLEKKNPSVISKKLGRTKHSIGQQVSLLKKAYQLAPLFTKYKIVRDYITKED